MPGLHGSQSILDVAVVRQCSDAAAASALLPMASARSLFIYEIVAGVSAEHRCWQNEFLP